MADRSNGVVETRVAWKDAFQVVGENIRFTPSPGTPPSANDIARLWPRFNDRIGEIDNVAGGMYGLCLFDPDGKPGNPFDYAAAVGVSRADRIPEGMRTWSFPGALYCVVTRRGVIDDIGKAFDYFRGEWLPGSGYEYGGAGVEFEYYDERYKGNDDPSSVMDIWFPIRPARAIPLENRVAGLFVHVTDLRRSAEWYSRLLGIPLMEERLNGGPVYWMDLPGTTIVLDSDANNRLDPEWREWMRPRVMFAARDIDDAYRYLRERAEPLFEPERHGSMAYFNFRDSEGNVQMACWTAEPGPSPAELPSDSPVGPAVGGVFVDVSDMRSAARWYTELLGLPFDEERAEKDIYAVPVARGAALLLDRNLRLGRKPSTEIFYFRTERFDAALAYVRSNGIPVADGPNRFPDLSEFAVQDPDGNRLVIACMKS